MSNQPRVCRHLNVERKRTQISQYHATIRIPSYAQPSTHDKWSHINNCTRSKFGISIITGRQWVAIFLEIIVAYKASQYVESSFSYWTSTPYISPESFKSGLRQIFCLRFGYRNRQLPEVCWRLQTLTIHPSRKRRSKLQTSDTHAEQQKTSKRLENAGIRAKKPTVYEAPANTPKCA